ncbi:MAG: hypothetical protein AAF242_02990 [Bacteroidota bacterium]
MKEMNLEFVIDESGNKKAVLIPFQEWEEFQQELLEFFEYRKLKKSLKIAFSEVKQIKKGMLPKRTMQNFLDEC